MERRVRNAGAMATFAAEFAGGLRRTSGGATVIALSGELGSGKTTFAQGVARALGVKGAILSPTFVIEKVYALSGEPFERLIHVDAYRLERADELRKLGWEAKLAEPGNLILIEWPERAAESIPDSALRLSFSMGEGEERCVRYG